MQTGENFETVFVCFGSFCFIFCLIILEWQFKGLLGLLLLSDLFDTMKCVK